MTSQNRKAKAKAKREPMPMPVPTKPRKPLGVVMPLTDAEIARLAAVTPEELAAIQSELVPELRELLDAKPTEGE